jgi:hypothetical protein
MRGKPAPLGRWSIGLFLDARSRDALIDQGAHHGCRALIGKGGVMRGTTIRVAGNHDLRWAELARVGGDLNHDLLAFGG